MGKSFTCMGDTSIKNNLERKREPTQCDTPKLSHPEQNIAVPMQQDMAHEKVVNSAIIGVMQQKQILNNKGLQHHHQCPKKICKVISVADCLSCVKVWRQNHFTALRTEDTLWS